MPHTLANVLSVGVRERTGVRPMLDANGLPYNQPLSRERVDENAREVLGEETDNPPAWTPELAAARAAARAAREAEWDHPPPRGSAHSRNRPSDWWQMTVGNYVRENGSVFSSTQAVPGDRVLSYAWGRVGTVIKGGRTASDGFHPAVVYDDDLTFRPWLDTTTLINTDFATEFFAVINAGATLPPIPWM